MKLAKALSLLLATIPHEALAGLCHIDSNDCSGTGVNDPPLDSPAGCFSFGFTSYEFIEVGDNTFSRPTSGIQGSMVGWAMKVIPTQKKV